MQTLTQKLSAIMADTYALYLKTQNYHWHVKGLQFKTLHELFEEQYTELAAAVDLLAELIVMKGSKAPASFSELGKLTQIKAGNAESKAEQMVLELAEDNNLLVKELNATLRQAEEEHDVGTVNLLSDRISAHEKAHWMLNASSS